MAKRTELSEQQKLKKLETKRIWAREYSRRYYQQHRERVLARTKEYHRIRRLQAKMLKEISILSNNPSPNRPTSQSGRATTNISESTMEKSA